MFNPRVRSPVAQQIGCARPLDADAVVACLNSDKKVRNGRVRFVVPRALGQVEIRDDISAERVGQALKALRSS